MVMAPVSIFHDVELVCVKVIEPVPVPVRVIVLLPALVLSVIVIVAP